MIHIAVLLKPYLDLVLSGKKTVECRLTVQAREPFDSIEPGERIYFKQSAGPYRAAAVAEHVICEGDLTPKRVAQIRSDYNDLIRGEPSFWRIKRNSRFCTLVWLADVQATDTGPAIRPLQGVAWLALPEEPAWRRTEHQKSHPTLPMTDGTSFSAPITAGNLKNNSLYVTDIISRFPPETLGGATRRDAGRPVTLILHNGPTVESDIVGTRAMLRTRVWGAWFRRHGAKPGDRVVFTPADPSTYFVGLSRARR